MKKIIFTLIGLIAIGIGYWLISPLFIDKEVNETVDPETEQTIQQTLQDNELTLNFKDQISEVDIPAFEEEMEKMKDQDQTVEDEMPDSPSKQIVFTGEFADVAHEGSGTAQLVLLADRPDILRLADLDVLNGPDLRLVLSKNENVKTSADLGDYLELGKLKGNKGNQNYEIPETVENIEEYKSVVIYCKAFGVVFNSADLT